MKKGVFIIFFILSLMDYDCFATTQETFLYANSLYAQGDYGKAQTLYESISNKGAAVWYNLGNCYYHLERYPEALACWKRSCMFGNYSWYADVKHNCKHVQELLGVQKNDLWYEPFIQYIMKYSLLWWQLLVIILCSVVAFLILWGDNKKYQAGKIALCCTLCLGISCLGIRYWQSSRNFAFIVQEASLMAGTDERFSKLAQLKKGEEVLVYEQQGPWVKVATGETIGWILAESIIII